MGRLDGKIALVTGAARGQGRSHALRLAQEGADIIAIDLCGPLPSVSYPSATSDALDETAKAVADCGRTVAAYRADVRDRDALAQAIREGVAACGGLDIVVANAGICVVASWDQVTPKTWQDIIDVNLTGTWNTAQLAAPYLVDRGGGSIVLASSAAGLKGLPFLAPYVASKHGVLGIMRTLAHELGEHRIRVNSVHSAAVQTPMGTEGDGVENMINLMGAHPNLAGMFSNSLPVAMVEPEDVSNAVLFLASDEARYVTALAMTVDAGNSQY
jgi:SDR family mycofactocin-dependent oxidoreductase